MRKAVAVSLAVAGLTAAASAAVIPFRAGDVTVTASYKGKGTVDPKHAILVFLFDHPTPTASSEPLAREVITKNGDTVTFKNVTADTVYVTLVYDEKSTYDGRSGPPPAGTPIGSYAKAGKAVPVKPGPDAKLTATFDDSRRWQ
ncbi:MAG TPA: hypothetical protein VFJ02_15335 [Vicinamibacterales bacterium]|nr:hypothetical protein [Vicinamibacterales bacterium]